MLQRWFYGCCVFRSHHTHMSLFISYLLYEGFQMECIHRCISQTSCWWSKRASLWAVSHLLYVLTARFLFLLNNFHCREVSHVLDHHWSLKFNMPCCPQRSSLIWKLIFMPGCLWSSAKRKTGGYLWQLLGDLILMSNNVKLRLSESMKLWPF